jgi:hypothetical protein
MPALRPTDEDRAELLRYMRPEEDLRDYRRSHPWDGELRLFRCDSVAKLEDYRARGEMVAILTRLQRRRDRLRVVGRV